MLTNTGIFLRGLKLSGESRSLQVLLVSKKIIGGNQLHSLEIIEPYIALYFKAFYKYCS